MGGEPTTVAQRLDREKGLEPVSRAQVIRYWLHEELDDDADDPLDPDAIETEPALSEELFERKPIAERAFGAEAADWYHADLSAEELRNLRVVVGPHEQDWRAVADDDRIGSIAERIYEAEEVDELDERVPKDLQKVVEMADAIDPEGPVSRLIVLKEGDDPAYVVDGNHRAVAHALSLLRGKRFTGQEAYLGVRE